MSKKTGESIPYSSEWEKVFSPGGDARGLEVLWIRWKHDRLGMQSITD